MNKLLLTLLIFTSIPSFSQNNLSNRKLFKEARNHFSDQAYQKSINFLNQLDDKYISKHPKTNYYLLRNFLEMGKVHKAHNLLLSEKTFKTPWRMIELEELKQQTESKIRAYDSLFAQAKKYFSYRNSPPAISNINKVIAIDSFYLEGYKLRSKINFSAFNFEEVIKDCDKLTQYIKDNPSIYMRRGLAHYRMENKEKSIPDFTKSISLKPTAKAYYYRARARCQSSKTESYTPTIQDLDSAITLQPNFMKAIDFRGGLYFSMKQYENALIDFNSILSDEPNDVDILSKRAECHVQLRNEKKAEADYKRLTEIQSYNSTAFYRKGFYSAKRNYYKPDSLIEAINYYDQAIAIDSTVSFYYYYRAVAKKMRSNYQSAIEDLNKAIALEPTDFDYYHERNTNHYLLRTPYSKRKMHLMQGIGNFRTHETDSLTKNYNIARSYRLIFNFLSDETYLNISLQYLDKALTFNENNVAVHHEKGLLYKIGFKDYAKAIKSFEKVLSIDPYHLQSHLGLAWCLNFNGEYLASYEAFQEAKKHFPDDRQVRQGLDKLKNKIN